MHVSRDRTFSKPFLYPWSTDLFSNSHCLLVMVASSSRWFARAAQSTLALVPSASLFIKEIDWFWNRWKIKTDWKHCVLAVGKVDGWDFHVGFWANQLPCTDWNTLCRLLDVFFFFYVCVGVKQSRDRCDFGCLGCKCELIQMTGSLSGLRHWPPLYACCVHKADCCVWVESPCENAEHSHKIDYSDSDLQQEVRASYHHFTQSVSAFV